MSRKVILTDCDGVLLNWNDPFVNFISEYGYEILDESEYDICDFLGVTKREAHELMLGFLAHFRDNHLPALRDAQKYVKLLHEEHGYVFHAITSVSTDASVQRSRTRNLKNLFGETAFEKFIYLPSGKHKDAILSTYYGKGYYWVEDNLHNAEAGQKVGLKTFLIDAPHNKSDNSNLTRAKNWEEIYNNIINK